METRFRVPTCCRYVYNVILKCSKHDRNYNNEAVFPLVVKKLIVLTRSQNPIIDVYEKNSSCADTYNSDNFILLQPNKIYEIWKLSSIKKRYMISLVVVNSEVSQVLKYHNSSHRSKPIFCCTYRSIEKIYLNIV